MGNCCHDKKCALDALRERQGKTLRIVLAINALLFVVEFGAGLLAQSTSLMADSLDSLGDALVYALSLYVLSRNDRWRAGTAMLKGIIMLGFGIAVTIALLGKILSPVVPVAEMIGGFGAFALACNASCLYLLTRHRSDDLNMESAGYVPGTISPPTSGCSWQAPGLHGQARCGPTSWSAPSLPCCS